MVRRRKPTGWPDGFEAYIRGREFRDIEELLLWDCASMVECFEAAEAKWRERQGWPEGKMMRSDEWKQVRMVADEIAMERMGRPLSMKAIRWGFRLAEKLVNGFLDRPLRD
jgi:hypothetical protein